jgi:toxin ParE1/3/4
MIYSFHEDAEQEFLEAIEYYEESELGLGLRFSEEVYSTIKRICEFPQAWERMDSNTRRCLTNKFPFGVLYRISNNEILVMAIMNLHRLPNYWKKKLKP